MQERMKLVMWVSVVCVLASCTMTKNPRSTAPVLLLEVPNDVTSASLDTASAEDQNAQYIRIDTNYIEMLRGFKNLKYVNIYAGSSLNMPEILLCLAKVPTITHVSIRGLDSVPLEIGSLKSLMDPVQLRLSHSNNFSNNPS